MFAIGFDLLMQLTRATHPRSAPREYRATLYMRAELPLGEIVN